MVVRNNPNEPGITHKGMILDYNADRLILDINGKQRVIKSRDITSVESPLLRASDEGDRYFADRQFEFAWNAYGSARKPTTPGWISRRLRAGRVKSARELGNWYQAAVEYFKLLKDEPATRFFDHIPLVYRLRQ